MVLNGEDDGLQGVADVAKGILKASGVSAVGGAASYVTQKIAQGAAGSGPSAAELAAREKSEASTRNALLIGGGVVAAVTVVALVMRKKPARTNPSRRRHHRRRRHRR